MFAFNHEISFNPQQTGAQSRAAEVKTTEICTTFLPRHCQKYNKHPPPNLGFSCSG